MDRNSKLFFSFIKAFFIYQALLSDRKWKIKYFWRADRHFSREVDPEGDTVDLQKISFERPAEKCLQWLAFYEEEEGLSRSGQENSLNTHFVMEARVSGAVYTSPLLCATPEPPLLEGETVDFFFFLFLFSEHCPMYRLLTPTV